MSKSFHPRETRIRHYYYDYYYDDYDYYYYYDVKASEPGL